MDTAYSPARRVHLASRDLFFFFQAEDGIRDHCVTGVQTCSLPIFDRIGGNRVRRGPFYRAVNTWGKLSKEQMAKALGVEERPIGPPSMGWITARDLYRAITEEKPYKVRALMA